MKYDTCLITGGTGTFGTAYTLDAIKSQWHKKIIIYSRDEYKQIKMFNFLNTIFKDEKVIDGFPPYSVKIGTTDIRFFIGDVCDQERLNIALRGVDLVLHAAALKHVPICEYNPMEAIKINVGGTTNVVNCCGNNNVKKLIALSTDKAVDPINIYGATKLSLEKVVLGGNMYYPDTRMSVVRYGNIIGSRGSIIHKLMSRDLETIGITDPEMTRFWLTIEEAVQLVRKASDSDRRNTIFVPKLKSFRLDALFQCLRPDLEVNIIGPRQGEKTHEKMMSDEDFKRSFFDKNLECYTLNFDNESKNSGGSVWEHDSYTSDAVEEFTDDEFKLKLKESIINKIYNIGYMR
tara:strand:+ start:927 stop:1967 length:1041 start_codon:yes stop_codon:yes gene_type:complete